MKRLLLDPILWIVTLLAVGTAGLAWGQCPGGQCGINSTIISAFEWRTRDDDPDRVYLYAAGVQVGGWCHRHGHYREYASATGTWGEPQPTAPVPPPAKEQAPAPPVVVGQAAPNYGIDLDKMGDGRKSYRVNGREVTREQAFEAVGAQIPDDADSLRVTWVGDAAAGERIRAALATSPAKVAFQSYSSTDAPLLRGLGFTSGLHVQSPAGKPLWFAAAAPAGEDLAAGLQLAEARRKDPKWEPEKWGPLNRGPAAPDPPRPLDGLRDLAGVTAWLKKNWLVVAAAIGGVFFLLIRKPAAPTP